MHFPSLNGDCDLNGGCACKSGYVLNADGSECMRPESCPCHHAGKSFEDGDVIAKDCNTCACSAGSWTCSDKDCFSECNAWGDSHLSTFDGKHLEFRGSCGYVLARGRHSDDRKFHVNVQVKHFYDN